MKKILFLLCLSLFAGCSSASDPDTQGVTEASQTRTIIALGDSLTAGYGLPEDQAYPAQLERKLSELGYNYTLENAGISGDTTAGVLSRLDWVLSSSTGSTAAPSLVILCIGANDAFQGKSPEDIEKNLRSIIEKIQAKNIPILFAGMKSPLNLGGDYGRQYEAIFPKLAKEYDLPFMEFFLEGVALKAEYNLDDRIHPTASGYAIIVENLIGELEDDDLITK